MIAFRGRKSRKLYIEERKTFEIFFKLMDSASMSLDDAV